nr:cupin domain-containing protein [Thermococcus sp. 18S1]
MALFDGEYHWHRHENEDELFYVYRGRIVVQLRGQPDVVLSEGEMTVVPRGMEHCPRPSNLRTS